MHHAPSTSVETPKSTFPAPSTRFRSLSDPESLRAFACKLREGIYISSRDGRILDANPAFLEMFGVTSLAEFGEYGALGVFADPARRAEQLSLLDRDGAVREFEIMLERPDGERRTALDSCYLIRDPDTGEEFIHGVIVDITARKHLEARLRDMSTHDPLTGAVNRHYLIDLEAAFAADPLLQCGCIFVDIDHFKQYNDLHGHQAGDDVLKHMARFLMRYTRSEEAVLRFGGDEFVVILQGADEERTKLVVNRFRVEALQRAPVPFSLGTACRLPGETVQQLLDRADRGMMAVRVGRRQPDSRRTD